LAVSQKETEEVQSLRNLRSVAVSAIRGELSRVSIAECFAKTPNSVHILCQVICNQYDQCVALLESIDHLTPIHHCRCSLAVHTLLVWLFLVQAANLFDLLERRQNPLVIGFQFLHTLIKPPILLLFSVLCAAIVKNFHMGSKRLIHYVCCHITAMSQGPKQFQHLFCHIAVLIIFCESSNQLQKFFSLLRSSPSPGRLEALEEVVQLLCGEVPGQLGKQLVHVLHDGLVLARLSRPDVVQVLQAERLLLDHEPDHLLQLLHILGLVQAVPQDNPDHLVLFDPGRHPVRRQEVLLLLTLRLVASLRRGGVDHPRDHFVHLVQRRHLAREAGDLELPQQHLQSEHLQ